ncbi:lipoyl(octanoyl) transferase LipB [Kordiimonas sp. A6E486]|nr:lipoyl(octanoyl) transferase LipB [Kordiimonas marina]MCJ9429253.1 lipoyl(octanoyl) transferase LipB [Kordiimonas marina]
MSTQEPTLSMPLEWKISDELVAYPDALAFMEERVRQIRAGDAAEMVWCLEHPPLYTAGTSADPADLVDPDRFPVYDAGRGGQYTYHGPGQRVVYFMLDLKKRGRDVRQFVYSLEEVIIRSLAKFGVTAERRKGRVGVWVERGAGREDKVAAIGVRVRQWVTFHGIAINVEPDLEHFTGIVPCGISEHGVTSLADLGLPVTMDDLDVVLKDVFDEVFGLESRPMHLEFQEAPEGPSETQASKLPYEAMPTESGVVEAGMPIEDTHPVFKV